MSVSDPHVFDDRLLRFSLRKPVTWDFMPPAWSPARQLKNANFPEWEWMKRGNDPFCCARKLHDDPFHAYPTLQVSARRFGVPTDEEAKALLTAQLEVLGRQFANCTVLQADTASQVDGCRATALRASYSLFVIDGDRRTPLPVLNRTFVIFSPWLAFTVSISTSARPEYFDEVEIEGIVASIRIGA